MSTASMPPFIDRHTLVRLRDILLPDLETVVPCEELGEEVGEKKVVRKGFLPTVFHNADRKETVSGWMGMQRKAMTLHFMVGFDGSEWRAMRFIHMYELTTMVCHHSWRDHDPAHPHISLKADVVYCDRPWKCAAKGWWWSRWASVDAHVARGMWERRASEMLMRRMRVYSFECERDEGIWEKGVFREVRMATEQDISLRSG